MDPLKSLLPNEKIWLKDMPEKDWAWAISWLHFCRGKKFKGIHAKLAMQEGFRIGFEKATGIFFSQSREAPPAGESAPDSLPVPGDDHAADVGGSFDQ